MKKRGLFVLLLSLGFTMATAQTFSLGNGRLTVKPLAKNAVRIQYVENNQQATSSTESLPEWVYLSEEGGKSSSSDISVSVDGQTFVVKDKAGKVVFKAVEHRLTPSQVAGQPTHEARLAFYSPEDECLFGLGQFQDGYNDVRGLSRRLTQVNTQISIPMLLSSKGYGILWNNYGLVDFNPADQHVELIKGAATGKSEVVDVTSTEGGKREVRERNIFEAAIDIEEPGDYSLMLDVGQSMARRHNLSIDGKTVIEMQNMWLPPTASKIVRLEKGRHVLTAELSRGDKPVLYYKKVNNETVFRSPVANAVDYTIFVGTPDEIISTYRELTGNAPLMPQWALGYIHCRERFHSQEEILTTAQRFRKEQLPVDVLVQDWQYWGRYGWNAMKFDEANYPNPRQLTDSLHAQNIRLMVSVWSKIDKASEVGRQMEQDGHYITGTDWIDFFSSDAASAYWRNFSKRLVPLGIDAWWQDATEPENDDLVGRRVNKGKWAGELVRNIYPLMVNKTVYEGLLADTSTRPMILTRCGFSGIQRYGAAMWSGDVGNDWETLRRQITAGLGLQAAGIPWWTYDAGGFFRPNNQYSNPDYIERMLRWIETSVYLPLMRVHGYMSNTEPWNYGIEAQSIIAECLKERYRLMPYIYSNAADVSFNGSTLMRPLVFDFYNDAEALAQKGEYMFGRSLLVNPITESGVNQWATYLPKTEGGWFDYRTNKHHAGGQKVNVKADKAHIPVFVRGGSILPIGPESQYTGEHPDALLTIRVYPGADGDFVLYEDDGTTRAYEQGECSRISFKWDEVKRQLLIGKQEGSFAGMPKKRQFSIVMPDGRQTTINYAGKKVVVKEQQMK